MDNDKFRDDDGFVTDDGFFKSLECCVEALNCESCPLRDITECKEYLNYGIFQLINRQKAEIEKLQNALAISQKETRRYAQRWPEAIEEFVKRLKKKAFSDDDSGEPYVYFQEVDEVAKEMTRGHNNEK